MIVLTAKAIDDIKSDAALNDGNAVLYSANVEHVFKQASLVPKLLETLDLIAAQRYDLQELIEVGASAEELLDAVIDRCWSLKKAARNAIEAIEKA